MTSAGRSESREFPPVPASSTLAVTAEQMREVDRLAVEEIDLVLIQMMENEAPVLPVPPRDAVSRGAYVAT